MFNFLFYCRDHVIVFFALVCVSFFFWLGFNLSVLCFFFFYRYSRFPFFLRELIDLPQSGPLNNHSHSPWLPPLAST